MRRAGILGAALLCAALAPAAGADTGSRADSSRNLFVLTGRLMDDSMFDSLDILGGKYENNRVAGAGFQDYFWKNHVVRLGYEGGGALRYGQADTVEVWAGLVARFRGHDLTRRLTVTPSVIFGLSLVDAAHPGRETRQTETYDGDARLLFYLSPEIEFSGGDHGWSLFWRLHHRSGGGGTLGNMRGASNANVVGLRKSF